MGAKLSVPSEFDRFPCGCALGQGGLVNAKQLKVNFVGGGIVQCGHCLKPVGEHTHDSIPNKELRKPTHIAVQRSGWDERRLGIQPRRLQLAFDIADSHGMAFVPTKPQKE